MHYSQAIFDLLYCLFNNWDNLKKEHYISLRREVFNAGISGGVDIWRRTSIVNNFANTPP